MSRWATKERRTNILGEIIQQLKVELEDRKKLCDQLEDPSLRKQLRRFLNNRINQLSATGNDCKLVQSVSSNYSCDLEVFLDNLLGDGKASGGIEQILQVLECKPDDQLPSKADNDNFLQSQQLLKAEKLFCELYLEPPPSADGVLSRCKAWRGLSVTCSSEPDCRWIAQMCHRAAAKLDPFSSSHSLESARLIASSMMDLVDEQLHFRHFFEAEKSLKKAEDFIYDFVPSGQLRDTGVEILTLTREQWFQRESQVKEKMSCDLAEQLQYNKEQIWKLKRCVLKLIARGGGVRALMSQAYVIAIRFRSLIDQCVTRVFQRSFCRENGLVVFQMSLTEAASRNRLVKVLTDSLVTTCPSHWVCFSGVVGKTVERVTFTLEKLEGGNWKPRRRWSTSELSQKKDKKAWETHLVLSPEDMGHSFRFTGKLADQFCEFEFKLGTTKDQGDLKVSPAKTKWREHISRKLDQFLKIRGKSILDLLESLMKHKSEVKNFPHWFSLLISITNEAKHETEFCPQLNNLRDAKRPDELLFFEVPEKKFADHSLADLCIHKAPSPSSPLKDSKRLLLQFKKVGFIDVKGKVTDFLLDQTFASLSDSINSLSVNLPRELKDLEEKFDWPKVIERIWHYRNLAMNKSERIEEIPVSEDMFKDYVKLPLGATTNKEDLSQELFTALSCQGSHKQHDS